MEGKKGVNEIIHRHLRKDRDANVVAPCAFPSWPVSSCSVLQLSSVAGFDLLDVADDALAEPVDVGPWATTPFLLEVKISLTASLGKELRRPITVAEG